MGRSGSGNSSWLDVVKKALRSPTKQTKTLKARMREDKDEAADKKRSNKRRWIFKKTCVHETTTILHDESMSSETTVATVEVIRLSSPKHNAALVIQTSFRRYLARRALAALKGVVKLQALVRGHNIRTRTKMTLSCMQALLRVQARLCDQRRKLISNQPTFHMGSHLALAHNHSTIWRSSQSEYRYCHEDLEEDRKDQTVQMDTYHISPSLIWERSQNQQQRLINSSSPLHHHNFQSHSPITPSSLSRIKTSVNPRCQREEKNPSYMSATVSAMARQRMPTTTDHGDKKTSARKRLSFGGGVSDSELDYNSTYAMETRLSISSCSKEKIQGEISPPSIGQHRRCFR